MTTMTPQSEALSALTTARKMLDNPEPLTGVRLVQLRGLLEYAEDQVTRIQAVKRTRKVVE